MTHNSDETFRVRMYAIKKDVAVEISAAALNKTQIILKDVPRFGDVRFSITAFADATAALSNDIVVADLDRERFEEWLTRYKNCPDGEASSWGLYLGNATTEDVSDRDSLGVLLHQMAQEARECVGLPVGFDDMLGRGILRLRAR